MNARFLDPEISLSAFISTSWCEIVYIPLPLSMSFSDMKMSSLTGYTACTALDARPGWLGRQHCILQSRWACAMRQINELVLILRGQLLLTKPRLLLEVLLFFPIFSWMVYASRSGLSYQRDRSGVEEREEVKVGGRRRRRRRGRRLRRCSEQIKAREERKV